MNYFEDDGNPLYKVLLLGESNVGKTSIIKNLKGEKFEYSLMVTIGVEFIKKRFDVNNDVVQLQIWDTAGQERFRSLTPQHYRNCRALLFVYDVTNRDSFFNLQSYWLNNVYQHTSDDLRVSYFLVGNKCDSPARQVTYEDGEDFKSQYNFIGFTETSALTGQNIKDLFQSVANITHQHCGISQKSINETVKGVKFEITTEVGQELINYISDERCQKCRKKMIKKLLKRPEFSSGRDSIKLGEQSAEIEAALRSNLANNSNCCSKS